MLASKAGRHAATLIIVENAEYPSSSTERLNQLCNFDGAPGRAGDRKQVQEHNRLVHVPMCRHIKARFKPCLIFE